MPKYRKKPVIVEAVKLTRSITIDTSNGTMKGLPGDYLITDKNGEQYPLDRDTFEAEYEKMKVQIDLKDIFIKPFRILKTKIDKA